MGATSFLSDAGLISRGISDTNYEDASRREDIAARQQTARLRGQQEKFTQMGLEDTTRARDVDARVRAAGAGATGGGMAASFDAMATAAENAGDPLRAVQLRQAKRKLLDEGTAEIVHAAMTNDSLGNRPDLAQIWNTYGHNRADPARTQLVSEGGDRVLKSIDLKTGQEIALPIGKTAAALGLVKSQVHSITAGGSLAVVTPGQPTQVISGPNKPEPKKGYELGTIEKDGVKYSISFNKDTGKHEILDETGSPVGTAHVTYPPAGTPGKPTVTIGGKLFVLNEGTPGTPATSGMPITGWGAKPAVPGKPDTLEPIKLPPRPDAKQGHFPDGREAWFVPDPKSKSGWSVLPTDEAPAPAAQPPAARVSAPAAAPAPAPAPAAATVTQPPAAAAPTPEVKVPQLEPDTSAQSPKERAAARRAVNAAKPGPLQRLSASMKAGEGQRVADAFRIMVKEGTFKRSDGKLIQEAIDSGLLNERETSTAQRMLAQLQPQTAGR